MVEDTFEDLLWVRENDEDISSKDKPYKSWKRISEIAKTESFLTDFPTLKLLYEFVFQW